MRKIVESVLEDLSSKDLFLFRVSCSYCGTGYGNKPIRFSKAGVSPATKNAQIISDVLYAQEFQAARQAAIRNAAENINYCPICGQLVCNRCFLICEDLDMCRQCASRLDVKGSPVMETVIEAVI